MSIIYRVLIMGIDISSFSVSTLPSYVWSRLHNAQRSQSKHFLLLTAKIDKKSRKFDKLGESSTTNRNFAKFFVDSGQFAMITQIRNQKAAEQTTDNA